MATTPDIARQAGPAPIDYDRLIRMLDAEMLESVGQAMPIDEFEGDETEAAPLIRLPTRRILPIASVGLVLSAVSVLILAHFSGM